MRVLLLSPYPERLRPAFEHTGDDVRVSVEPLVEVPDADWIVSFGYRHIIREPVLSAFAERSLNIHISLLPWNRGADPNLWAWFDDTPHGVTIHRIAAGLDTGDVFAQKELIWADPLPTLRSSYDALMNCAGELFSTVWPVIRDGDARTFPQRGRGSYHKSSDKTAWWSRLPLGYDTPVRDVQALARNLEMVNP